jgi:predicted 3-demethylubiquinone-9 3-methyltransferase (glyoxalase superfamily)
MSNTIYPCLWFNGQAKAAAEFYCSVFRDARIVADTPMVVNFQVGGQKFMCLNGGPQFTIGPAVSFFVMCEEDGEVEELWNKLLEGGSVMMPLEKYDWSEKYGWLQDKFGVSWQIALGKLSDVGQKCTPSLLFTGAQHGRAEEAVGFYTSLFPGSSVDGILRYSTSEGEKEGSVQHAQFRAGSYVMMAMDSAFPHAFQFTEAVSFVVECGTQEEIDRYWKVLTEEGGEEGRCGWLKDRFGVSWQIIPANLGSLLSDPSKGDRAIKALMQMNKLDIEKLQTA